MLVGMTVASGQCSLFIILFHFGARGAQRWPALRRRVDNFALQRRKLIEHSSSLMTLTAAIAGVPPTVPLFTIAPTFHMRLPRMLAVFFVARFLRFALITAFASWTGGSSTWPTMLYHAAEVRPAVAAGSVFNRTLAIVANASSRVAGAHSRAGFQQFSGGLSAIRAS